MNQTKNRDLTNENLDDYLDSKIEEILREDGVLDESEEQEE